MLMRDVNMGRKRSLKRPSNQKLKILYCRNCGLPYGFRTRTIEEAFTPEGDKLRKKFKRMKHCTCKDESGWED